MNRYTKTFVLMLIVILSAGACVSLKQARSKVDFYTLEYDPPQPSDLNPLDAVIRVERFTVAPDYNTDRIIYRQGAFKRDAYVYHKWRANPGDLVASFLRRDIRDSGLFRAVLSHDSGISAAYLLEGSVDEFVEWDEAESWKAVLALSVTLMAENEPDVSERILFQKTYQAAETCRQRNPAALAEAMSRAMKGLSNLIIKDTYEALQERSGSE